LVGDEVLLRPNRELEIDRLEAACECRQLQLPIPQFDLIVGGRGGRRGLGFLLVLTYFHDFALVTLQFATLFSCR